MPAGYLPGRGAEGSGERGGTPGVEGGRPGEEDRVDGGEDDEHDRERGRDLVEPEVPGVVRCEWAVRRVGGVKDHHGHDPACRDRGARRGEHQPTGPAGGQSRADQQWRRQVGGEPDRDGAPPWCPCGVIEQADGAGTGGAQGRDERRRDSYPKREGKNCADAARAEGRVPAVPSSPAPGPSRSGAVSQPGQQPDSRRDDADDDVLTMISTAATSVGGAADRLHSPTRRDCSAMRPPTNTATLRQGEQDEQPWGR